MYDWAGEIRTIDMGKGEGLPFQPLELFSIGVHYSEGVLRGDDLLKDLGHEEFVKRLSVSYNNFNILHPFREGNGRTQRISDSGELHPLLFPNYFVRECFAVWKLWVKK